MSLPSETRVQREVEVFAASAVGAPVGEQLLEVRGLHAGYGASMVLHGIDLVVGRGEVVVALGSNGAGKTTLMRVLAGLIPPERGTVLVDGTPVGIRSPEHFLRLGVGLVPQGRGTLADLSVLDNLRLGATCRRDGRGIGEDIEKWCDIFPVLGKRQRQVAATLSGGEQQMLAIARAMMSRPRLLLCDEVSLGLAPIIVQGLFEVLRTVNQQDGISLLLVEQNAELALDIASRVYLLEVGSVVASGATEEFRRDDSIRRAYLGY